MKMKFYEFSGNLAIFCSDERFFKETLKFLSSNLNVKVFDVLAVPGGPAFVVNKERCLISRLKLLIDAHNISRIIIFTHEDCGYYKNKFGSLKSNILLEKQLNDVKSIKKLISKYYSKIELLCYFVYFSKDKIKFRKV